MKPPLEPVGRFSPKVKITSSKMVISYSSKLELPNPDLVFSALTIVFDSVKKEIFFFPFLPSSSSLGRFIILYSNEENLPLLKCLLYSNRKTNKSLGINTPLLDQHPLEP